MNQIDCPFTIVYDTREQTPFEFLDIVKTIKGKKTTIQIPTKCMKLNEGDYSIDGLESQVAIERKSVSDLVSTVFHERDRFEKELSRLNEKKYAAVLVEGSLSAVLTHCRDNTAGNPSSLRASIIAWDQRFKTRWWFAPSRFEAARLCYFILDRFYRDMTDGKN